MTRIVHSAYACVWNFGRKFFLRGEECKTRENSNFMRKGKTVILVRNLKFFLDIG